MFHNVFSVYDNKAKAYLPPFIMHNDAMAVRVFGDCVNSEDHQFGKHPDDYTLFRIGVFDDVKGLLTKEGEANHMVAGGRTLLRDRFTMPSIEDAEMEDVA